MRVVFMGTPEYVIPPCKALLESSRYSLVAVVTPPAGKYGRGKRFMDPPLARWAKEVIPHIPCLQPKSISELLDAFQELSCDLVVTAAYGKILSQEFLDIPTYGVINIHPSKLPRYRGATPVQEAILQGDSTTSISILKTLRKLDAGPVIVQKDVAIGDHELAGELLPRLFELSGPLLLEACEKILQGLELYKQEEALASYCGKLDKAMGLVDFSKPEDLIYRRFRAFSPWPGSYTYFHKKRILLLGMRPLSSSSQDSYVFVYDVSLEALRVGTGSCDIAITSLKPEGKRAQSPKEFWHGLGQSKSVQHPCFDSNIFAS